MIVDSSALVAIVLGEPDHAWLLDALVAEGDAVRIGAPTMAETAIVLTSRIGPPARALLERLLDEILAETVPFTPEHWPVALDAFQRFGKGRHPAALNLGDCFTYATTALAREPLLCTGEDFARTDLQLVRPST